MSIVVEALTVRRGGRAVVRDLGFTVEAGTCTAVVGPNGSGKSTLLAALAGDLPAEADKLLVSGGHVSDTDAQSRLRAVMTQQTTVAFGFTVREVVRMGRAPWSGTQWADQDDDAVEQAVRLADISHLMDRGVQQLSGGELARVAFARVLAQRTPVLLLDEPTAALDLRHQVEVLGTVRRRADRGASVLVVLHDLSLAASVADQVLVMADGQMAALGPPDEILDPELLTEVYGVGVEVLRVGHGRVIVPVTWVNGS